MLSLLTPGYHAPYPEMLPYKMTGLRFQTWVPATPAQHSKGLNEHVLLRHSLIPPSSQSKTAPLPRVSPPPPPPTVANVNSPALSISMLFFHYGKDFAVMFARN
ncbi:transcription factor Sp5-like [Platysternon megacephalum]|uniref:Transcription factor Sp5-like n=1 Tax=Platysternon megacephalum TaxID=55544 RepID=A0A4D9EB75_9SAUR|nr:transcription factor Sp5-like [Platysternon megacephalum]